MSELNYPVFLQFETPGTWYKIIDDHTFIEVKTLGEYYTVSEFSDDILPMRNHVSDLLEHMGNVVISEMQYQKQLDRLKLDKTFKAF